MNGDAAGRLLAARSDRRNERVQLDASVAQLLDQAFDRLSNEVRVLAALRKCNRNIIDRKIAVQIEKKILLISRVVVRFPENYVCGKFSSKKWMENFKLVT